MAVRTEQLAPAAAGTAHGTGYQLRRLIFRLLDYGLMILLAIFFLFPLIFMLVSSLKGDEGQVLRDMSSLQAFVPSSISFQNYQDVFKNVPFGRNMLNSVIVTGGIVALGLLVNSMIAYSLARINFRGRSIVLAVVVSLIIIPFQAVAVPLLLLVNSLPSFGLGKPGWIDSYHVQIIPFVADAFSIFLFYQFFIAIPKDLEEAALVDGAGRFRIYWSIIIPLSKPVFATVAILQFLSRWGELLWPVMVTRGDSYRPLPVAMQTFFGQQPRQWGDIMAFAAMVTIPVLVIFLIFQRWFVQSVTSTGVKG